MRLRSFGLLLVLLLITAGAAATELVVDGITVPGLDQQTVPGVSYAPAQAFASALGAELNRAGATVSLSMGARNLELRLSSDPVRTDAPGSVAIDGRSVDGHAALDTPTGLLLPVKTVTSAFGGVITVLTGNRDVVQVRMPRARLASLQRSTSGGSERLLVELTAHVPYAVYFNEQLATLQLTFGRTELGAAPEAIDGVNFGHAWLQQTVAGPELRVRLAEGSSYDLAARQQESGWQLVITFSAPPVESESVQQAATAGTRAGTSKVVITHAGSIELTDLTLAVANRLRAEGVEVLPGASASAALHLFLAAAADSSSVQYLGDPADQAALQQAVQLAGGDQPVVEQLRRELLLGVHGDLTVGRQAAMVLGQELGLQLPATSLPYSGLVPAAGKGVLLQLGLSDLTDPGLPERLATALLQTLGGR